MEVSRRRVFPKNLEPARPLRRCYQLNMEPKVNAATCAQAAMEEIHQQNNMGMEHFLKIIEVNQKQKKDRISYSRDFLVALASCPQARKKPEFLPEHPVVLNEAREPGNLQFDRMSYWTGGAEGMVA